MQIMCETKIKYRQGIWPFRSNTEIVESETESMTELDIANYYIRRQGFNYTITQQDVDKKTTIKKNIVNVQNHGWFHTTTTTHRLTIHFLPSF